MYLLLAALLIAADQTSKWWVSQSFSGGSSIELGLGFQLTFVRNTGAAFGLLRDLHLQIGRFTLDGTLLLGLLSATVAAILIWYLLRRGPAVPHVSRLALALVLAGAIGNMIDRLLLGYVVDFIHFRSGSFDFPVFNLADTFVVTGGILLFLAGLFGSGAPRDEERELAEPEFFRRLDHDGRR